MKKKGRGVRDRRRQLKGKGDLKRGRREWQFFVIELERFLE
jgi:hypothetical protein